MSTSKKKAKKSITLSFDPAILAWLRDHTEPRRISQFLEKLVLAEMERPKGVEPVVKIYPSPGKIPIHELIPNTPEEWDHAFQNPTLVAVSSGKENMTKFTENFIKQPTKGEKKDETI